MRMEQEWPERVVVLGTWSRVAPLQVAEGREKEPTDSLVLPASMGIVRGDRIEPKWRAGEGRGWGSQRPGDASNEHNKCKEDPCALVNALPGFLCMRISANRHPLLTSLSNIYRREMAAPMSDSTADGAAKGHTRAMLLGGVNPNSMPWTHIHCEVTTSLTGVLGTSPCDLLSLPKFK